MLHSKYMQSQLCQTSPSRLTFLGTCLPRHRSNSAVRYTHRLRRQVHVQALGFDFGDAPSRGEPDSCKEQVMSHLYAELLYKAVLATASPVTVHNIMPTV